LSLIKKILVFLSAVFFLVFVGLWVLYFYSYTKTNKENSIISFIPSQTEFVLKVQNTSTTTNEFLIHPLVKQCFNFKTITPIWNVIDSVTSRNYKTAEVLSENSTYLCIDSMGNTLVLIDLNKKTNNHFIDQFLATSTSNRKIERFKEGYKAFYPTEKSPMFYFVKQNVFGVSYNQQYVLNSLQKVDNNNPDSSLVNWDTKYTSNISVWGKGHTESSVLDSIITNTLLFNGWLSQLTKYYMFDVKWEKEKLIFSGECIADSFKLNQLSLSASNAQTSVYALANNPHSLSTIYHVSSTDSLNNSINFVYSYQQFKDSANINTHLFVADYKVIEHLYKKSLADTLTQLIPMADDKITEVAIMPISLVKNILPAMPIVNDTIHLFCANYKGLFFVADQTTTLLNATQMIDNGFIIKKSLEKGFILQGERLVSGTTQTKSQYSFALNNGVLKMGALLTY